MKSLSYLLKEVLDESSTWCHVSTDRDLKTISARIEDEGYSFITITLPAFAKDLEKGLDQGRVDRHLFTGFSRKGELPRFLGGFLDLIFDRDTGVLLDSPSIDAIRCVRQICLMFSKVAAECSDERVKAAIDGYIKCEQDVKDHDVIFKGDDAMRHSFERLGSLLWSDMFSNIDREIFEGNVIPKHGPGATADRLKGNRKYDQTEWPRRLEEIFPSGEFLFSSWSLFFDNEHSVDILEPEAEIPVKVITVPKTPKSPRIIAVEPTAMQYVQQGILRLLVENIRTNDTARNLIGFEDQTPNQHLAEVGSRDQSLATLDLSEASDRVSYEHVRSLLARFPHFAWGVDACRSRKARVPGHGVIRLAKFASMGSALCFPFEAIVFTTVVFLGIERALNRQLSKKDIKSFFGKVRIYGDDIIVPTEYASSVVATLELFGFKVNTNKSFWTGKFRESCGKDFYAGHDVTVVKAREELPSQRRHAREIVSAVSLRNQLYKSGYWRTVKFLDDHLEGIIPFPVVAETSPVLGKHSFLGYETQKISSDLHRPQVKGMMVSTRLPVSRLDGPGALLKYFLNSSDLPVTDREHLLRAGRPVAVDIKHRWGNSY